MSSLPIDQKIINKLDNRTDVVLSKFNVGLVLPGDPYGHVVYNTLTGSITKVNEALSEVITGEDLSEIDFCEPSSVKQLLMEQGILVARNYDEIDAYEKLHQKWKRGSENVEINALLTYDCNFECPYCYQGRGAKGARIHGFNYMDDTIVASVEQFAKETVADRGAQKLEIVLYGGEPFLPNAKQKGIRLTDNCSHWATKNGVNFALHVLSNGSLITEDDIKWLSGYSTRIQIPVDGAPRIHNRYRFFKETGAGSFYRIVNTLELTRKHNLETHIRVSLTEETYPTMVEMLNELERLGLNHVYPDFCYITAFTNACEDFKEHTLSDNRLFKLMPELWLLAHNMGFPLDIRPQVQPLPCSSIADGSFIIDPMANIYKCWEHVGIKEHVVGKLHTSGFLEPTSVYGEIISRNPVLISACRNHSYLPACGGGCVCKAHWKHRTYNAPGCGTERFLLKDKIRMYLTTLGIESVLRRASTGSLIAATVEGKREPLMRHCYVLV